MAGKHPGYVQVGDTLGWSEFLERLYGRLDEQRPAQYGDWIFRGQRQSVWGLQAGLRRLLTERAIDVTRLNAIMDEVLTGFRNDLLRQGFNPAFVYDGMALLGLAQHYGVPTNLLDWSYSPYVAAYFALQSVSAGDGSAAIWALDTRDEIVSSATDERTDSHIYTPQLLLVPPTPYENIRLRNQAGVFTFFRSSELTIEEFLVHHRCKRARWPLLKFVIDSDEAERVRRDLALMMIGDGHLFPGVESAALRARKVLQSLTSHS